MRADVSRKRGSRTRTRLIALNARLRACRKCHLAGFLDERESVPIVRDPEPDAPVPRILLIGQAPGLRATLEDRPFAGAAGEKLRDWLEQAGIPREDFCGRSTSPRSPAATPAESQERKATASHRPRNKSSAARGSTISSLSSSRKSCSWSACWRSAPSSAQSPR